MDPSSISGVMASPAVVYAGIVVMILIMVASAVPKILGPFGKSVQEWQDRRRAERAAKIGADISDAQRQIEHLERERDEQDARHAEYRRRVAARESRWRAEKHVHDRWDYRVQQALIGHDPPFDLAPEFMTPDPPCPNEGKESR